MIINTNTLSLLGTILFFISINVLFFIMGYPYYSNLNWVESTTISLLFFNIPISCILFYIPSLIDLPYLKGFYYYFNRIERVGVVIGLFTTIPILFFIAYPSHINNSPIAYKYEFLDINKSNYDSSFSKTLMADIFLTQKEKEEYQQLVNKNYDKYKHQPIEQITQSKESQNLPLEQINKLSKKELALLEKYIKSIRALKSH